MGNKVHIKRNDIVVVISGSAATGDKTGKVLQVLPVKGRAIVEGVNFIKKNVRKNQDNPKGAIVEKEATVAISNLLLYCPDCKKAVRISRARQESGKLTRQCKICSHAFDD